MALFVPVAPAQCCKTCLSNKIHPLDSCSDLNFCSGHGVCNLGTCDCLDGYGGPDCSSQVAHQTLPSLLYKACLDQCVCVLMTGRLLVPFLISFSFSCSLQHQAVGGSDF